jgi:hypothetical protein
MNKKGKMLVLLLLTLLLWGYITLKIFNVTSTNSSTNQYSAKEAYINKQPDHTENTHSLLLNYVDPFLKTPHSLQHSHKSHYRKTNIKTNEIQWPEIVYMGCIRSGKNTPTILLLINKEEISLEQGKSSRGITFIRFLQDSVLLSFNNEKHFYNVRQLPNN